jgi:hypothetical protein
MPAVKLLARLLAKKSRRSRDMVVLLLANIGKRAIGGCGDSSASGDASYTAFVGAAMATRQLQERRWPVYRARRRRGSSGIDESREPRWGRDAFWVVMPFENS